tara:strand:- start:36 stop:926 length:891 start_codon:yes stop_codon:yes gene_type:complete
MADSRNRQLAQLGTGLDVNEATGEVITINMDTDVVSEGTSNLYFTDARVYSTLSGSGNLVVGGNLTVNGTTTTLNSTTLDVDDLNITVAKGAANSSAANGAGLTVDGANATFTYTSSDDRWNLNKELNVTRVHGNLTGNVTGQVSDISNHDTDTLSEGSTNLYYTDARVTTRINATSIDALSDVDTTTSAPTSGQTIVWNGTKFVPGDSFSQSDFNTAFAAKSTDDLSEGVTNLYYTNGRFDARFSTKNIGDLANVFTTGVTDGQVLVYSVANNRFEPGTVSGGGGSGGLFSLLDF